MPCANRQFWTAGELYVLAQIKYEILNTIFNKVTHNKTAAPQATPVPYANNVCHKTYILLVNTKKKRKVAK